MSLIVSAGGELIALKALIGALAQTESLVCGLFTSNITPAHTDNAATYTAIEAAGGGYSRTGLAIASWVVTANPITYPQIAWTFTGPLTGSATVYGYFILRASTLDLIYAENVSSTGFQPLNNGDSLKLNLQLGAT